MTARTAGKARAIRGVAITIMLLCASAASAQTDVETMQFGITVQYQAKSGGVPVHASLIPITAPGSIVYPQDKQGNPRPVHVIYNLDIWGGSGGSKTSLGDDGFNPKVTVLIRWFEEGKPRYPHIYYFIPALGRWISHAEVASGRSPVKDMAVSPIEYDSKEGCYRFTVTRWPAEDRMMCHDN